MTSLRTRLGPANHRDSEMRDYPVGKRSVLVAKVDGAYRALDNWCNHAGCLLSGGRIEGSTVICPCHEVGFDLLTGRNTTSPEVCGDQPAFPVEIVDGQIEVVGFDPNA